MWLTTLICTECTISGVGTVIGTKNKNHTMVLYIYNEKISSNKITTRVLLLK